MSRARTSAAGLPRDGSADLSGTLLLATKTIPNICRTIGNGTADLAVARMVGGRAAALRETLRE